MCFTTENSLAAPNCSPPSSLCFCEEDQHVGLAGRLRHGNHHWRQDGSNWAVCQKNTGCDKALSEVSPWPRCKVTPPACSGFFFLALNSRFQDMGVKSHKLFIEEGRIYWRRNTAHTHITLGNSGVFYLEMMMH